MISLLIFCTHFFCRNEIDNSQITTVCVILSIYDKPMSGNVNYDGRSNFSHHDSSDSLYYQIKNEMYMFQGCNVLVFGVCYEISFIVNFSKCMFVKLKYVFLQTVCYRIYYQCEMYFYYSPIMVKMRDINTFFLK